MDQEPKHLQLDDRRRVSLAKIGRRQDWLYIASVDDDGVITLTPAALVNAITGERLDVKR